MFGDILLWIGVFLIIYAFYKWLTIHGDYFKLRGVPYWQPICFFGNNIGFMMMRGYSMNGFISMLYRANPGTK